MLNSDVEEVVVIGGRRMKDKKEKVSILVVGVCKNILDTSPLKIAKSFLSEILNYFNLSVVI